MTNLSVDINGVKLKNPVIAASGAYGFGKEYAQFYDPGSLGAICTKGLTLESRQGNDGLRIYETASGILNSVGLQNPGIQHFIDKELLEMQSYNTVIIANVGGGSSDDYLCAIEQLNSTNVDIIELNISCPNVKSGGMAFGIKSKVAYSVVNEVKKICKKPLMVKLSPNAEDIVDMAVNCVEAGADSISLINTLKAMAIDINARKPFFDNVFAGLSGPAIKPVALRMVYEVAKAVEVPVIGIGGICDYKDAVEFIMAGAHAVQIGTANFINPMAAIDIINGLKSYMEENKITDLNEIRGII